MSKKDKIKILEDRIRVIETEGAWWIELADQERRTREAFQRIADALDISLNELYETMRLK